VRFAIAIANPQHVPESGFDTDAFRAYLQGAEELGFEGGWTQEEILGKAPTLSPLETLTSPRSERISAYILGSCES
jgi:hypothetical protein